jgi:chromosome partitioning protein
MSNQMRLAIMTGAGGVGKTTLAANLGYEVARLGYRVVIFDPQGSINVACRLNKTPAPKQQPLGSIPVFSMANIHSSRRGKSM